MKRKTVLFLSILALAAGAQAQSALPGLKSPAGAVYRVVTPAATDGLSQYPVKPADAGDPLPDKTIRISVTKATTFGGALNLVLADTNITVAYIGEDTISSRSVAGLKLSGQLKAVIDTLAQAANVQYVHRDGVLRFMNARPYTMGFPDVSESAYLADMVRRNGGTVLSEQAARREILFSADYAAIKRIQSDILGLVALKRDPSQTIAGRAVIAPDKPGAATPAAQPVAAIAQPLVRVTDGKATIRWKGEVTELVRQMAAAAGAMYAGTEGKPRAVMVDVAVDEKPVLLALEAIGNAMGEQADLVVKGKKYSVMFR